jgi:4-hydroxybenzoate polyprenyltransferase
LKLMDWLHLARPRQWPKNLLLLAAMLFAGRFRDPVALGQAFAGFVAFVLLSGAVYALNDTLDAEEDRRHKTKRHRPIAAGRIGHWEAALLGGVWTGLGLGIAVWLGPGFLACAIAYLALSVGYSTWTKHQVILDVISLSAGFVLRAAAGAYAVNVRISAWLLVCTTLLALFLGLAKRRAELAQLNGAKGGRRSLQHYSLPLLDQMIAIVSAATLVAYALYAMEPHGGSHGPWMLLTVPFVLYGIFRYLYLSHEKGLGSAPEQVLLGDRALQVNLVLYVAVSAAILSFLN